MTPLTNRLTREEIEAARSPAGGYTRAMLAAWGVPWPPPRGWQQALMRGETPTYREPREKRLGAALDAAELALREYHNGDRAWAERWLLAAHAATKEIR